MNTIRIATKNNIDNIAGILLLLAFITGVIAAGLSVQVGDYNIEANEIGRLLNQVAEKRTTHIAEMGFDLLSFILTIGLGAVLYVLLSPFNRLNALLGTFGFTLGAIILAAHDIPHFVFAYIADEYVAASGAQVMTLETLGFITLQSAMWGLSIGIFMLGAGGVFYSIVLLKGSVVHKSLGWIGIVSGIMIAAGVWMPRYDQALYEVFIGFAAPFGIWQLALGIWFLIKGSRKLA